MPFDEFVWWLLLAFGLNMNAIPHERREQELQVRAIVEHIRNSEISKPFRKAACLDSLRIEVVDSAFYGPPVVFYLEEILSTLLHMHPEDSVLLRQEKVERAAPKRIPEIRDVSRAVYGIGAENRVRLEIPLESLKAYADDSLACVRPQFAL